jgi:hypothetical protein
MAAATVAMPLWLGRSRRPGLARVVAMAVPVPLRAASGSSFGAALTLQQLHSSRAPAPQHRSR